jgi:hypothetical protein
MDARRFAAVTGIAWVLVTGLGVTLFTLAGIPPSFTDGSAYAEFISRSSGLFLADAFTTGLSATLLVAFVAGLVSALGAVSPGAGLVAYLLFGFGVAVAGILAVVGILETVTVYVATNAAHAALTAPFYLVTQTAVVFLYFPGAGFFLTLADAGGRLGFLPRWNVWICGVSAALLAVATLATLGGTGFLGPLGLVQVLVGFLPAAVAFLAVSLSMWRPRGTVNSRRRDV